MTRSVVATPRQVLFIAGWGRSGSTLLDIMLGSLPGFTAVGELRHLWLNGLVQRRRCGCGVPVPECPVWASILDAMGGYPAVDGTLDVDAVRRDRGETARIRHAPAVARGNGGPAAQRLRHLTARLVDAISDVTDASVVVDSSKKPIDLALLLTAPGIDVHVVHLVRDPRAVAFSWQRTKLMTDGERPRPIAPHSPTRSSVMWSVLNAMSERLATRAASYRRVRYEDLVADPTAVLEAIVEPLEGVERTAVRRQFDADGTFRIVTSHTVAGNPSRFASGQLAIRADEQWRTAQPTGQRLAATAPALPLLARYGYPVRPGGG